MLINYYAPGTPWEFRMWAADQITAQFPTATLVAVHDDNYPNLGVYNVYIEDSSSPHLQRVTHFTRGLFQRWIRGGFSLNGKDGIETASLNDSRTVQGRPHVG